MALGRLTQANRRQTQVGNRMMRRMSHSRGLPDAPAKLSVPIVARLTPLSTPYDYADISQPICCIQALRREQRGMIRKSAKWISSWKLVA